MTILVTGASGQQGGAVAHHLLKSKTPFRAVTRNRAKLSHLSDAGVEVVQGDLTTKEAFEGVESVFLITSWFEDGPEKETEMGINCIDLCVERGVKNIVFTSVANASRADSVPHFQSKALIEEHLKKQPVSYTILRPAWFMENFLREETWEQINQGTLSMPCPKELEMAMISLDTIGAFGAASLLNRERFEGAVIELASDQISFAQIADELSSSLGKKVTYTQLPIDSASSEMRLMFEWFNSTNFDIHIDDVRQWGIALPTFKEFLAWRASYVS